MEPHRLAVYATVAVVVVVAIAAGPLVGAVDLTDEPDRGPEAPPGTGSVDVAVESLPDRAELDRGEYGAEAYTLRVPDARVGLSNVTGRPMVVYKLELPALGYSRGTVHFVTREHAGPFVLELERDTVAPDSVDADRDAYEGRVTVLVRADGERIVERRSIDVRVRA